MKETPPYVPTTMNPTFKKAHHLLHRVGDKGTAFVHSVVDTVRRRIPSSGDEANEDSSRDAAPAPVRDHQTMVQVEEPSVPKPTLWESETAQESAPIGAGLAQDMLTDATGGDSTPRPPSSADAESFLSDKLA